MNEPTTRKGWFSEGEDARLKGDGINTFNATPCRVKKVDLTRVIPTYEVQETLNGIIVIKKVPQGRLLKDPKLYHEGFNEMIASLKAGAANL